MLGKSGLWTPKPFVAPQAPGALGVEGPALTDQHLVGLLPPPPRVGLRDLSKAMPKLQFAVARRPWAGPLRRPVLGDHIAGSALGDPEAFGQGNHGPAGDAPGAVEHDNGGVDARFVVVSGPAASGKTTLARALAAELDLPLLAKDTIKTAITTALAVSDPPAARRAGQAAVAALIALAAEMPTGAVLDSVWRSGQVDGLRRLNGRVVEVFCRCDFPILKARYAARFRPPGYVPEHADLADLWSEETMRPLHGGWPVIDADTSRPMDMPALAERVTAALRQQFLA